MPSTSKRPTSNSSSAATISIEAAICGAYFTLLPPCDLTDVRLINDAFVHRASKVALREHTRLRAAERRSIDWKRRQLRRTMTEILTVGVRSGELRVKEPEEAARAIIGLTASVVEPFEEMHRSMPEVIAPYQECSRGIACSG